MAVKMASGAIGTAVAVLVYLQTYHTDAEAAQLWEQHQQAEACRTVAQLKTEIRAKETQIQFDKTLTEEDRQWLREQIKAIQDDIVRFDPNGVC